MQQIYKKEGGYILVQRQEIGRLLSNFKIAEKDDHALSVSSDSLGPHD